MKDLKFMAKTLMNDDFIFKVKKKIKKKKNIEAIHDQWFYLRDKKNEI